MKQTIYSRPAIPLLISLIFGILLGSEFSGFEFGAGVVALFSAFFVLLHLCRRRTGIVFPLWLFLALGYLSIAPWLRPDFPLNHITAYAGSTRWDVTGVVDGKPRQLYNRARLVLRVVSLENGSQHHPVSGKLRLTVAGDLPPLAAGDTLRFNSRVRLISNFNNPGGFDYRRYMAFRGIRATAYARTDRLSVVKGRRPADLDPVGSIRREFSGLVEQCSDADAGAVLKALIIGDRGQISSELRQSFNRAGAGHLLAISGLHIGIVATVAFAFFQIITSRIHALLWRAWSRKGAALLSLLPVVVYGLMAGFSPSTQRAVIMVALFLLTFVFESEQDPLNTLALAALLILVLNPPSLFSISFQLSFSAVLGIIYGLSRLRSFTFRDSTPGSKNWLKRGQKVVLTFLLVSCLAVCGSLPLVAYHFNQISLIGIAANLVLVPLVGFVAVPLGLAALTVLPLSMTLAAWLVEADMVILSNALVLVRFFADLPFAAAKVVTPSLLEIACLYTLGWTLLNLGRRDAHFTGIRSGPEHNVERGLSGGDDQPPRIRVGRPGTFLKRTFFLAGVPLSSRARVKITLVLILLILAADGLYWMHQRFWHSDLRVTVIDVGHGSASLAELPGGHTVLVDGGGFSDNSAFDVGERIIAPLLWHKKIKTVDTVILSHPNSDHLNGLIYILLNFKVNRVWTNNEASPTKGYRRFMDVIASRRIEHETFNGMKRHHRIHDTELDLLYPPPNFLKLRYGQRWRNTNNNSMVVKISLNSVSFLFPGDIMAEAERELISLADGKLDSTVLIAPHHGSRTSSTPEFLHAVRPEVTVISAGRSGRLQLPHATVLQRYQDRGCRIFHTARSGAVQINTDGRSLDIKPFVSK